MKTRIRFLVFLVVFAGVFPGGVRAHITQYAGSFAVLLHLEPGDDPVAYEPAKLFFYVSDREKRFEPEDCRCVAEILHGGERIAKENLAVSQERQYGTNVLVMDFVFPGKGVYPVVFTAESRSGAFEPFRVQYDQRVEREGERSFWSDIALFLVSRVHTHHGGEFVLLLAIFFGFFVYAFVDARRKKYRRST